MVPGYQVLPIFVAMMLLFDPALNSTLLLTYFQSYLQYSIYSLACLHIQKQSGFLEGRFLPANHRFLEVF